MIASGHYSQARRRWRRLGLWRRLALAVGVLALIAIIDGRVRDHLTLQPVRYAVPTDACGRTFDDFEWTGLARGMITCLGWELNVSVGPSASLPEAVSAVWTGEQLRRAAIQTALSRDGHRVLYLHAETLRYTVKDLRTGKTRAVTPPLTQDELIDNHDLRVSPDNRFFAVTTSASRRTTVLDFESGASRSVPGFCVLYGADATRTVGDPFCVNRSPAIEVDVNDRVRILHPEAPWFVSPDLGSYLEPVEGDRWVIRDIATGKEQRAFQAKGDPAGWQDEDTLLFSEEIVNLRTGKREATEVPMGSRVVLGRWS